MTSEHTTSLECFYQNSEDNSQLCPRCGSESLEAKPHTLLLATGKQKKLSDHFATNASLALFCPKCPSVIIDSDKVEDLLGKGGYRWKPGDPYRVLGIIEPDEPLATETVSLGRDDIPEPVVEFEHLDGELLDEEDIEPVRGRGKGPKGGRSSAPSKKAARETTENARNALCWCGSGKKYKKCHLMEENKRRPVRLPEEE